MSRRKHGTECVRGISMQRKWVELESISSTLDLISGAKRSNHTLNKTLKLSLSSTPLRGGAGLGFAASTTWNVSELQYVCDPKH